MSNELIDKAREEARKWWRILNNPNSATFKIAHAYARDEWANTAVTPIPRKK